VGMAAVRFDDNVQARAELEIHLSA